MPGKQKKYSLGRADLPVDLKVPSGNVCSVRRVGPQGLLRLGLLDNLDRLTALVKTEHFDRVDGKAPFTVVDDAGVMNLVKNPKELAEALSAIDRVVCHVVVDPILALPPPAGELRAPGLLYADDVDDDDKMFIFQYVMGGSEDLAAFRKERAEVVERLADVEGVGKSAE